MASTPLGGRKMPIEGYLIGALGVSLGLSFGLGYSWREIREWWHGRHLRAYLRDSRWRY